MKPIIEYLKALIPLCERRELLNLINNIRDEHNDGLMPVVQNLQDVLSNHTFTSPMFREFEQRLRRHVNYKTTTIALLLRSIENLQSLFPFLEKETRDHFGPQIASNSMSYDSVNILRYLDSVAFYVRYARKFLLKVVADESVKIGGTPQETVKGEREWLEQNLENFAGLLPVMLKNEGELRTIFRKVSSAVVDEATSDLAYQSLGNEKIDPLRLANFTPQQNWLMSLGRAWVEWQVARHRSAEQDLIALKMRLLEMKELVETGKASPAVQSNIKRLEDRITKLDTKLSKTVEDAQDAGGAAA